MERGHLYQQWDNYMGIPRDLSIEQIHKSKEQHLKKLLGLLLEVLPASSDQLHELIDIHSISNVLTHEFMLDVKSIGGDSVAENFAALVDYLSRDRGAVMVIILGVVGIRDLVHGLSFGKCLISILKQFILFNSFSWPTMHREIRLTELEEFVVIEPRHRKVPSKELEDTLLPGNDQESNETSDPEVACLQTDIRARSERRASARLRKQQREAADQMDSDSDTNKKLLVVFREMRRTFRNVPDLVENLITGTTFYSRASELKESDPSMCLPKIELGSSELCLLLASVLKDVCFDDDQYREEKSTCMHLLPLFEDLLDSLVDQMYKVDGKHSNDTRSEGSLGVIGRCLMRIYIVLTSKISSQIDGLLVLHSEKTPNSILTRLCTSLNSETSCVVQTNERFLLSYDIISACFRYTELVLSCVSLTPLRLASALDATQFVLHNYGLELLEVMLLQLDEECSDEHSTLPAEHLFTVLLRSVGRIVGLLKLLRAQYIHLLTCTRRSHRQCSSFMSYAHHHDVLGLPSCVSFEGRVWTNGTKRGRSDIMNSEVCAIAVINLVLVSVFEKSTELTKYHILSTLMDCGLCCCIPVDYFTKSLLSSFRAQTRGLSLRVLDTLASTYLTEFGGAAREVNDLSKEIRCMMCTEDISDLSTGQLRSNPSNRMETSDSALSDSDSLCGLGSTLSSRWSCLKMLLPYLSSTDDCIACHAKKWILRLVRESCAVLRYELLYFIFLPVLQEAERILVPSTPEDDQIYEACNPLILRNCSVATVQFCLYILPELLVTANSCELFIASNGIPLLENLVGQDSIRSYVLHVFQKLAYIEESRQEVKQPKRSTKALGLRIPTPQLDSLKTLESECGTIAAASLVTLIKLLFRDACTVSQSKGLCQKSNLWNTARMIFTNNELFQQMFVENNGPAVAQSLLIASTRALLRLNSPLVTTELQLDILDNGGCIPEKHQEIQEWFSLVRASLSVCLSCARRRLKFGLQSLTVDELLEGLSQVIVDEMKAGMASDGALQLLCEVLLICVNDKCFDQCGNLSYHFMNMAKTIGSPDHETLHVDPGLSQSGAFLGYDGYEADYEMLSDAVTDEDDKILDKNMALSDEFGIGTYPELCRVVLNVVINCQSETCRRRHQNLSASTDTDAITENGLSGNEGKDGRTDTGTGKCMSLNQTVYPQDHTILESKTLTDPTSAGSETLDELDFNDTHKQNDKVSLSSGGSDLTGTIDGHVSQYLLKRLAVCSKHCVPLIAYIHRQNLVETFISCYKVGCAKCRANSRGVLQELLELILCVAEYGLSSKALSSFLSLFNDGDNLDMLLSTLYTLTARLPVEPKYSLRMPVAISALVIDDEMIVPSSSGKPGFSSLETIFSSAQKANHYASPVTSAEGNVVYGATKTLLQDVVSSVGKADGKFSMAFWMMIGGANVNRHSSRRKRSHADVSRRRRMDLKKPRLQDGAFGRANVALHVLSFGNTELMLQIWIKIRKIGFLFRIVSNAGGIESILGEVFLPLKIQKRKWHHLTLTYEQLLTTVNNNTSAKMMVRLDGLDENPVTMRWISPENSTSKNSGSLPCCFFYLGHCYNDYHVDDRNIYYHLGNLFLFQDLLLTKWMSFFLFSLGPDCSTLSQCDSGELNPMFPQQVYGMFPSNEEPSQDSELLSLASLRNSLLLSYSPSHPYTIALMKDFSADSKSKKNLRLSNPLPINDLTFIPSWIRVQACSDLVPLLQQETLSSIRQLGGIGAFVYLFAKVVECSSQEAVQVESLRVIFNLVQRDKVLMQEFIEMGGYAMIVKVFLTVPCVIGFEIVKILLDACVTTSLVSYDCKSESYVLDDETDSLIHDVHIITDILLTWSVWNKAASDIWLLGFRAIDALIRPKHRQQEFNVKTLLAAGAVEKLFNICLERLQLSYPSLSLPLCRVFLSIISNLTSIHPDIHQVLQICDFLLLTHPAANTFVFHNPTTFCFRNKWIAGKAPATLSYEGNRVIVSRTSSDSKSNEYLRKQLSGLSFQPDEFDQSEYSASESSMSDRSKWTNAESLTYDGHKTTKSSFPNDGIADSGVPSGSFPVTGVPNGSVTDSCISNGNIADVMLYRSKNDCLTDCKPFSEKERSIDISNGNSLTSDRAADMYNKWTEAALSQTDKPLSSAVDVSGFSRSTSFPDGDNKSVIETGYSDSQDGEEFSDVFQREIVCGSVSPTRTSLLEDELSLQLEQQALGLNPARKSPDSKDFHPVLYQRASDSVDFSSETQRIDGVDDAEACGVALMDAIEKDDEGLVYIVIGLLELVIDLLPSLKATDLERIFNIVLRPQVLVVMVHHRSSKIRVAVLKMVRRFLKLCNTEQMESFSRLKIFLLIANQLHQHATDQSIVEECLSILVNQSVQLDEFAGMELPIGIPLPYQTSVNLLLSVAENSVLEPLLCRKLLLSLQKVFISLLDVSQAMLENGLAEVLCNMVHRLGLTWDKDPVAMTTVDSANRQAVMENIQRFFCLMAQKTFCTTGSSFFQQFEETFILLKCLETRLRSLYGLDSYIVSFAVSIQCEYLKTILESLLQNSSSVPESSFSFGTIQTTVESFISKLSLPKCFSNFARLSVSNENLSAPDKNENQKPEKQRFSFSFAPSARSFVGSGLRSSSSSLSDSSRHLSDYSFRSPASTSKETLEAAHFPVANGRSSDNSGRSSPRKLLAVGNFEVSLTSSEFSERFKKLITTTADYVLFRGTDYEQPHLQEPLPGTDPGTSGCEANECDKGSSDDSSSSVSQVKALKMFLLEFLMQAVEFGIRKCKKTVISTLMTQTKDVLKLQLSRLLMCLLSPSAGLDQSLFAIEMFNQKPSNMDIIKLLMKISDTEQKLSYYSYFLVTSNISVLTHCQRNELGEFIERMVLCEANVIRPGESLSPEKKDGMKKEMDEWSKQMLQDRREWLKKEGLAFQRVLHRLDGLSKKLSSQAMEFTQIVNNDQNRLRKKFIGHVKQQMSDRLQVKKAWQKLIMQLSHERGVWHCASSYPCSWQLDPTEGPSRQRCKLRRCHLNMEERFLLPEHRRKLEAAKLEPPLFYLFHDDKLSLDSAAVIYKLHTSENIEYTCICRHVMPQTTTSGVLLMGQRMVYYVADEAVMEHNYTQALLENCDDLFMTLPHDDITEFHKQWYLLRDEALEIFLSNGKTCLLALNSTQDRNELYARLMALDLPNVQPEDNLLHTQLLWLEGSITNFEYLMHLNKMAGRSFNDLMQYPVFPFILSQYMESTLDLENPRSYRDLSKTISTQFKEQENKYIQLYEILVEQWQSSDMPSDILLQPYHYTNHYSNVATVLQFLVRLPPFTQMFIDFQDRNFDCADRMFHSIQMSYNLVTKMSITDSKELIPEFFYLPEFFENPEGFNFGIKQNGQVVNHVELPPWCQKNARLFTLIHRQALESDHVTRMLASWIDLVFGFKQRGKAAVDAVNVFRPSMYFGIDVDAIDDALTRQAVKTMIRTHGQTPKQLFKNPHPSPPNRPRPAPIKDKPLPLPQIFGLHWGSYVGSPDCPNPTIVHCKSWKAEVASLVALHTGDVFGLPANSCFLIKQKGTRLRQTLGLKWAAVLSWNHRDAIIRLKNNQKQPPVNILHWNPANRVTCAASLTNCCQIFFGTELGYIVVLNTKLNTSKLSDLQVFDHRVQLFGHSDSISCLCVCQSFSVLVSGSIDSACIIWDLNKLCYVRSITDHKGSITALCVSNSSGDIASVSNTADGGSCLMIHTINARYVGSVTSPDRIRCIAYSPGPEGQFVNVIAGGLSTGRIRLWSSWDLSCVRELAPSEQLSPVSPVLSLMYSQDGQNLFCLTQGLLTVWGNKPSNRRTKKFNFIPLL